MRNTVSSLIRAVSQTVEEFTTDGKVTVPSTSVNLLASRIHDQWSEWARSLEMRENLTPDRLQRWNKLYVPYEQLSEDMKDKDREYAVKFLNDIHNDVAMDMFRGYLASVPDDWNYILPEDLHKMLKSGELNNYCLIDLRKPEDYAQGHIPGAVNIFWLDLMDNMDKLPMDKRIIIYCYLGHTSSQVLVMLQILGFNVKSLKFGLGRPPVKGVQVKGWLDYNYEVAKS